MLEGTLKKNTLAPDTPHGVTTLLTAVFSGDRGAEDSLFSLVYHELHALARAAMKKERRSHTLQATALVNELYLRLLRKKRIQWESRSHFFNAAAMAMKRILVSEARRRKALKRGGKRKVALLFAAREQRLPDDHAAAIDDLQTLDRALKRFRAAESHRRMCRVVDLHLFGNLTMEETARELGVSKGTVKNDWTYTKAWLLREMNRIERDE